MTDLPELRLAMALFEIDGLSFRVPTRTLLEGLDLSVATGEIHAQVGTDGTAKNILAYLIVGCEGYLANAEEIRFDGRRIDGLPVVKTPSQGHCTRTS